MTQQYFTHHARAILALGLPLIGSHLAQMGLHVANAVMLGRYGVAELAAGVLGGSSFFTIFVLGSGFAQAVMPMVAAALGEGNDTQVRRDARMGLWLSILYGVLIYPLFWYSGPLLLILGQTDEVSALGQDYLRIAGLGMVPALMVMSLKSYLAALERTQVVLWVTLAAVVVNVGVNWFLIFGNGGAPELGVQGAALASLTVQILSLVILGLYAGWLPELRKFHLWQRFWRPDFPALAGVFRLGWPIGLTGLAESGLFQASALMMGWIGTVQLASHGIAMEATSLAFMLHLGLSNAVTVRTGYANGAADYAAMRMGGLAGIALSLIMALAIITAFLTIPQQILWLFIDPANPKADEIIAIGTTLLALAALFQLADAMQVIALGLLRGVKDTKVPMALASVSYWLIGIPASYVLAFPLGMGAPGLWLGLVLGLACAATSLMARFWLGLSRRGAAIQPPFEP